MVVLFCGKKNRTERWKEEREIFKKPADGVWGSDSRGCRRPGESRLYGQMCLCARRVCACVEYASACDGSSGYISRGALRVRSSLFTRADQRPSAPHKDKRYIIIIVRCVVVGYTFYPTKIITPSNRSAATRRLHNPAPAGPVARPPVTLAIFARSEFELKTTKT